MSGLSDIELNQLYQLGLWTEFNTPLEIKQSGPRISLSNLSLTPYIYQLERPDLAEKNFYRAYPKEGFSRAQLLEIFTGVVLHRLHFFANLFLRLRNLDLMGLPYHPSHFCITLMGDEKAVFDFTIREILHKANKKDPLDQALLATQIWMEHQSFWLRSGAKRGSRYHESSNYPPEFRERIWRSGELHARLRQQAEIIRSVVRNSVVTPDAYNPLFNDTALEELILFQIQSPGGNLLVSVRVDMMIQSSDGLRVFNYKFGRERDLQPKVLMLEILLESLAAKIFAKRYMKTPGKRHQKEMTVHKVALAKIPTLLENVSMYHQTGELTRDGRFAYQDLTLPPDCQEEAVEDLLLLMLHLNDPYQYNAFKEMQRHSQGIESTPITVWQEEEFYQRALR